MAERSGNSFQIGYTLMFASLSNMTVNEWPSLLEFAARLERLAEANPYFIGAADFCTGVAFVTQGKIEEGSARTRRARVFWEQIGYRILLPLEFAVEVPFVRRRRCARQHRREALAESEGSRHQRPVVLLFRGDLLVRLGAEPRENEAAYREAIECSRAQSHKLDELQASKRLARWLQGQRVVLPKRGRVLAGIAWPWLVEGNFRHFGP